MKSLIRTIAILTVLNLATTSSALARNAVEEKTQEVIEKAMTLAEKEAKAMVAQRAAETAQRNAEIAQRQTETVLQQKDALAARVNQRLTELEQLLQLTRSKWQYGGGGVLVIPTAEEIKPQDLVTIMEDMNVMARIFDKKLAQSYLIQRQSFNSRIRISTPFSRDSRSTGAMYIQGYGTLFLTNVDFPLSPPPKAEEVKETEEEDIDPVWEQMKQEMYEPEDVSRRRRTDDRPEEKYDPEKVENLKTTLIKALKHAANIRGLKPDEWVNVATVSSSTILTVRAKRSDIDAFSKGELDFDEFRQKVVIFTYPCLPGIERGRTPSINVRNPIAR